ncbi:hypothetical protein P3X46_022064 [Hevea brasiliensis]|uniref:diaminohydroxyphosphoribosylaminopyrimidine deaminase n=1 Tax=Hevea brasiliensis TaxID=3981 RepID=A0ABQ9LLG8_HEVBR|nr:hypothetical protein P3X46_022064 [Hevea brasiliensis]
MQIQYFSLSNRTLGLPNLSRSHMHSSFAPAPGLSIPGFRFHSKFGCCNSVKRLSKSLGGLRRYGGLVMVSCGVLANDGSDEGKDDGFYMRRCVEMARKAIGCTRPNPLVCCVIVKDGKIVGEGFHPKAGQPHAEVFALRDAGDLAEKATAYVSLEPCNHYGRTPPCTEALINAKAKKVVIGMVDPNPIVASTGVDKLRHAGIDVIVGVEEELCKRLNEAYIHQMLTGKPFVTLRHSLSVNGHLLNQLEEGVTECGGYYSKLLQEYDAIIVSSSLIHKFLVPTSQEPASRSSPMKIRSVEEEAASKMIIFTDKETTVEPVTAQKGIETVVLDGICLNEILEYGERRGLCSILLDLRGGFDELQGLLNDGIEQNMLQKVTVEVLPLWDENSTKSSFVALKSVQKRLKVNNLQPRISHQSIILEGYL